MRARDYSKLQVLSPLPSAYTSGSVAFRDSAGNVLPGVPDKPLDATGSVSLVGLDLDQNGLPQFLLTLVGVAPPPPPVTLEMTWTGPDTPDCGGDDEPPPPPPPPAVPQCVEDGINSLPLGGLLSQLLHNLEPGLRPLLEDLLGIFIHSLNCDLVVPIEDLVDQIIDGLLGIDHHQLAPADFDGNGTSDVAVFRPSDGRWYVNGGTSVAWGTRG